MVYKPGTTIQSKEVPECVCDIISMIPKRENWYYYKYNTELSEDDYKIMGARSIDPRTSYFEPGEWRVLKLPSEVDPEYESLLI